MTGNKRVNDKKKKRRIRIREFGADYIECQAEEENED